MKLSESQNIYYRANHTRSIGGCMACLNTGFFYLADDLSLPLKFDNNGAIIPRIGYCGCANGLKLQE